MRVRNKELRQRWHRKDQRIKELIAEAKSAKGGSPKPKAEKVEKKAAAPKKAAAAPKAAKADAADKPKRAPKKKSEDAAE